MRIIVQIFEGHSAGAKLDDAASAFVIPTMV
jgi:hypothetical protein